MDKNTDSQNPAQAKACCSTDKSSCGSRRCCVGKALAALLVIGLVAALAFCAGTRHAQTQVGAQPGAKIATQSADNIPTLRP